MPNHIIKKQVLDLKVDSVQESASIQDRVRELYYHRIVPRLEKEFDQQCPENRVLRLDSLELNLGELATDTLEEQWEDRVETVLMEQVREQIQVARLLQQAGHGDELNADTANLELLQVFLKTGNLPWWRQKIDSLDELLQQVLQASSDQLLTWLRENRNHSGLIDRLFGQFSQATFSQLLAALTGADPNELSAIFQALGQAYKQPKLVWKKALLQSLQPTVEWGTTLTGASNKKDQLVRFSRDLAIELARISGNAPDLRALLPELVLNLGPQLAEDLLKAASGKDEKQDEPEPEAAETPEELYLQNAGLVLFWPYLDQLFKALKLTYNNEFVNEMSRQKAVHVLQYLATGNDDGAEFDLPLNKLLCGLPVTEALDIGAELNAGQKEEADQLVSALIRNWEALNNTTPEGFRTTFVNREGRLVLENNTWTLLVHRETFDLLLDRLPWGIGEVNLPWMNETIYVEW